MYLFIYFLTFISELNHMEIFKLDLLVYCSSLICHANRGILFENKYQL